ncbi:MAG: tetrahydromethanopterin S-methyltransferase subunit H [Candidatus Bathyarchaeota archaeon]|nr:MAG: tetrahydromethanopterin S-methyltransferase subunit H [Candidatus Bathyarchaeota archaeon]
MFRFKTPQKVFEIGKTKIGGQPGEFPTVLIGSIFYKGHKIVKDSQKGFFDKNAAEKLIKNQEELCDSTGNPGLLDVVVSSAEAVERFVDFVSSVTETSFLFDAWPPSVRIEGLRYLEETGLLDKAIYNSISPITRGEELNAIKDSGVKAAIVLSFNFKNPWSEGLLSVIRGTQEKKGLLSVAKEAGIEIPLVDCSVTSVPSIGISARTIRSVKAEFGIPSGCGAANASTRWKEAKKWGLDIFKACEASLHTLTLAMCADFLMYGPIESANWIVPASAAVDATIAAAAKELGTAPATSEHPLCKLFPEVSAKILKSDG